MCRPPPYQPHAAAAAARTRRPSNPKCRCSLREQTRLFAERKATIANTADIYQVVSQWNIRLPNGSDEAKILFYNQDADANYACRVDYANQDAIE